MYKKNDLKEAIGLILSASEYFGITMSDLRGQGRQRDKCEARFMTWKHMYDTGNFSLKFIGYQFGGRDHTTVIHGLQTMEYLLLTDDAMRLQYDNFCRWQQLEVTNIPNYVPINF